MAIISASAGFSLDFDVINFTGSTVSNTSATEFRLTFDDGSYWVVSGTSLAYGVNDLPTAGTIAGFTWFTSGNVQRLTASGLSLPAEDFSTFVQTPNTSGFVTAILAGADTVNGDAAIDDIRGGAESDVLIGGNGGDLLRGQDGGDVIVGDSLDPSLVGTGGEDFVLGDAGADYADGGAANDSLLGEADADWLEGGDGDDVVFGGDANDALFGGAGNDTIGGNNGDNFLRGGEGDDSLFANNGSNWAEGGAGNDDVSGGAGENVLFGGIGDDRVEGIDSSDHVDGGAGADWLIGNDGNDVLDGDGGLSSAGAGNDLLHAYDGDDIGRGGGGDDWTYGGAGNDLLEGNDGNDRVVGEAGSDTLLGNDGRDVLRGEVGADTLWAGAHNDTLLGGSEADVLDGEDGNDHLTGGSGNDVLNGGAGSDTVFYANSIATIGSSGETLTINAGAEGIDTLIGIEQFAAADTLVPAAPIITGFTDDDGTPGDNITSDPTPTVSGTAEPNILVTVFRGDISVGSTTADANGAWSFTSDSLAPGFYDFAATATDLADNTSALSDFLFLEIASGVVVELTSLGPAFGFVIQGDTNDDYAGRALSNAGDVNGDGFDDLIVGAPYGDDGGNRAGEAYVVFGDAGGFGVPVTIDGVVRQVLDLTSLGSGQGFIVQSDAAGDYAGVSVAAAGDVNGDGFSDLIVGAHGSNDAGGAFVIFGGAGAFGAPATIGDVVRQVLDLGVLATTQGFFIEGDTAFDYAGLSVSSAGDIDGDGFGDLLVGARGGDDGGDRAGEAYVVFGAASIGTIALSSLVSAQGFIIQGDTAFDLAGASVSSAGDVNGDGYADMIVGAPLGYDGGNAAGEAYVVLGSASGFGVPVTTLGVVRQVVDLTSLTSSLGFVIQGDTNYDDAGSSVSSAGDVNGDGFDDLIVGAPPASDGGLGAGEAYVVFGTAAGFGTAVTANGVVRQVVDLTSLTSEQGFIIQGADRLDFTGTSVSAAGDVNGDGLADMIVGTSGAEVAYVVFGTTGDFGSTVTTQGVARQVIDLGSLPASQGYIIRGDYYDDQAGQAVGGGGDINGDGFDDILVGAPQGENEGDEAGEGYVIFGTATGPITPSTVTGSAGNDILIGGPADDTLIGDGDADVFRGGAANDVIQIPDFDFADIDGGNGIDTLQLVGSALHLDLTTILPTEIQSIEVIDLAGGGNNTLTGSHLDFFGLTEERGVAIASVRVDGNSGDTINLDGGWVDIGDTTLGGNTYDRWQFDPDAGGQLDPIANAELWIDQDIAVLF